ncbi:MAG: hypothetical protein EOL97_14255 [Spirochaetia bacterium]|nr:hypothetical protein [Spirochaetia bacterium]
MNKQEIIKKLKNIDVDKEIKWIYTLAAYIIKNSDDDNFHKKFQNRVNSTIRSHNKSYRKYISDNKWEEYRKKEREKYKTDKKQREYQLQQQRNRNTVYNLYKEKKLSKKSMSVIDEELYGDLENNKNILKSANHYSEKLMRDLK